MSILPPLKLVSGVHSCSGTTGTIPDENILKKENAIIDDESGIV